MKALYVYMAVLYGVQVDKSTEDLEAILPEFREKIAPEFADAPPKRTALLRRIMNALLDLEGKLHLFQEMVDCMGTRVLLQESYNEAPHLLSRVVARCSEEEILGFYRQFSSLTEEEARSAYEMPFTEAFRAKKFRVITHLYAMGAKYGLKVDRKVCGQKHPLVFAAEQEDGLSFAEAYLDGMQEQKDRGISRYSDPDDRLCLYSETLLGTLVKSGRCDILQLLFQRGLVYENALSREGYSLLDLSEGDMQALLLEHGARPAHHVEHLLHRAVLEIYRRESTRLQYIKALVAQDPRHTRSVCVESDILHGFCCVDLWVAVIAMCDLQALELLLDSPVGTPYDTQVINGLKSALKNCARELFPADSIYYLVQCLLDHKIQFFCTVESRIFVLQTIQDLLLFSWQGQWFAKEVIVDICLALCRLFNIKTPVELYSKAAENIFADTAPAAEEVQALFIAQGWQPKQGKKRKEKSK